LVATSRVPAPEAPHCRALDITDITAVRQMVRDVQPTVIVNPAAYTAVDRAESEPQQAMVANGTAPRVLAEEARRVDALLLHYSTDYVFDGHGTQPWRESDVPCPLSVYGKTKLAGEEAIRNSGARHIVLRISWIYAAHGKNFVKTMLRLGSEKAELKIVDDQIGAPTPASLVAAATADILRRAEGSPGDWASDRGGIVHLSSAGETSWRDFAEEIFRLARAASVPLEVARVVPIATAEFATAARRPLNSRLDCTRLDERFGLRLPDWRDALAAAFPAILAQAHAHRA
jgi:dTDP-4-dehydrorhamnose reductase